MKISDAGMDLIKRFEGCELEAYRDAVGVWTIGYGHTAQAGPPAPFPGQKITQAEAEALLRRDLASYEAAVRSCVGREPSQAQFDAMTSLCYNIGPGAFRGSSVVRRFNDGDDRAAADAFLMWNKAGGKVLRGLTKRRNAEREMFLSSPLSFTVTPQPSRWAWLWQWWG